MSSVSADNPNLNTDLKNNYPNSGNNGAEAKTASAAALLDDKAKLEKSITKTPDMEQVKNPDAIHQNGVKGEYSEELHYQYLLKSPTIEQQMQAAKKLLAIPKDKVPIPKELFEGVDKFQAESDKESYLKFRQQYLEAKAAGMFFEISQDADGNKTVKTVANTQGTDHTSAFAEKAALRLPLWVNSLLNANSGDGDKSFLSLLRKAVKKGTNFINTMRPAILSNPSAFAPEGPDLLKDGKYHPTYRSLNHVSSAWREHGISNLKDPLAKTLGMVGLGGVIRHVPGEKLYMDPKVIQFSEVFEFLNKEFNFLDRFEKLIKDNGSRVLEYKSIPTYLMDTNGDSSLEDWIKIADLYEEADEKKYSDEKFIAEFEKLNVPLDPKNQKLFQRLKDPNDKDINRKNFFGALRYAKIISLVPHAINGHYQIDERSKLGLIQLIGSTLNHPKTRDFVANKYGINRDANILNINNKRTDHLDFNGKFPKDKKTGKVYDKDSADLIDDLKNNAPDTPTNDVDSVFKIVENKNPYFELVPVGDKERANKDLDLSTFFKENKFLLTSGDSPSDAGLIMMPFAIPANPEILANLKPGESIIDVMKPQGGAIVTRGQIDYKEHLVPRLIKLLQDEQYKDSPLALAKIDDNNFKFTHTGEVIDKKTLEEKALKYISKGITRYSTVHAHNNTEAGVALELANELGLPGLKDVVGLKDPKAFNFDVDESAPWIKAYKKKLYKEDAAQALIPGLVNKIDQEAKDKGGYKKPLAETGAAGNFLSKIPVVGKLLSLDNAGDDFKNFFKLITAGMALGGAVGLAGDLSKNKSAEKAGINIQRLTYIAQTLVTGTAFYMMNPDRVALKGFGEWMGGLLSNFFRHGSPAEVDLRALSEVNIGGVGILDAKGLNMNIDGLHGSKAEKEAYTKQFSNPDKYINIRNVTSELTEDRKQGVRFWQDKFMGGALRKMGAVGDFMAKIIPELQVNLKMAMQFFQEKGLRVGVLKSLLPGMTDGPAMRMSKNNGMPYKTVHSVPHVMAAGMVGTVGSLIASDIAAKAGKHSIAGWLGRLGNVIPVLSLLVRANTLRKNLDGTALRYTDYHGKQHKFNPIEASNIQMAGLYAMLVGGAGRGIKPFFGFLQNLGLGGLMFGMAKEFSHQLNDAEITQRVHQGKFYAPHSSSIMTSKEQSIVTNAATNINKSGAEVVPKNNAVALERQKVSAKA